MCYHSMAHRRRPQPSSRRQPIRQFTRVHLLPAWLPIRGLPGCHRPARHRPLPEEKSRRAGPLFRDRRPLPRISCHRRWFPNPHISPVSALVVHQKPIADKAVRVLLDILAWITEIFRAANYDIEVVEKCVHRRRQVVSGSSTRVVRVRAQCFSTRAYSHIDSNFGALLTVKLILVSPSVAILSRSANAGTFFAHVRS